MENALTGAMARKPFLQATLSGVHAPSGWTREWVCVCETRGDKHLPGLYWEQHFNRLRIRSGVVSAL